MHRDSVANGGIYMGALFFTTLVIIFNGFSELTLTIFKLPIFFKQRDLLFYSAWTYTVPSWILKIPITFLEVGVFVFITYYAIGFDPDVVRWVLLIMSYVYPMYLITCICYSLFFMTD